MSLIVENISRRYGAVVAVAAADLEVEAGEIVCLFGPSGCGKTTLLRLIAGLEPPDSGRIELDGAELAGRATTPPERRPIGFVFQDYVLFPHLTIVENVAFGVEGRSGAKRRARAMDELRSVGLGDFAKRYPHELSGGQQQRAALARALVRRPKAMLLDEPFASIETELRRNLRDEMRRMLKDCGAATIVVTHDSEEALALGDRIAVMAEGRLIETASPEEFFHSAKTPEGASIFSGAQQLEGHCDAGIVRTAFGEMEGVGVENGPVIVVALPGAVTLAADANAPAEIVSSRFMGPRWLTSLAARGAPRPLRVETQNRLELGVRFKLRFDPGLTRVFARGA